MYSDYRDQEKQTAVNILGSILEQLLAALPDLPKEVAEKLEAAQKYRKSLGTSDMIDMLDLTFPQFKHIFICIDALDELEQRTWMEVLEILKKFMAAINIQLFLTGRPHIEPGLNKELELSIHNVVTISAHPEDIRLFVSRKLQQAEKTDPESLTQQLKEQILSATVERSQGMYVHSPAPFVLASQGMTSANYYVPKGFSCQPCRLA